MTTKTDIPYEKSIAFVFGWTLGWATGALRALVAMKGWEWFVADTFGLPTLSFIQTWGLFMLISFAVWQFTSSAKNKNSALVQVLSGLLSSVLVSGFFFLAIFILSLFL